MATNKVKTTKYMADKNILIPQMPFANVGVIVNGSGVTAVDGKKIIKAGTPVGGATSTLEDENAVLSVANDATAQGVLMHDVDVTAGEENATLIIFGFVNENRMDNVDISVEAKAALGGKVTFLKRN